LTAAPYPAALPGAAAGAVSVTADLFLGSAAFGPDTTING
jgi:hypothetical protein